MTELPRIIKFSKKRPRRKYRFREKAYRFAKPFPLWQVLFVLSALLALWEMQTGHSVRTSREISGGESGDLVGFATVIDGDTIEIDGQRIRLYGIDAPEKAQLCRDGKGHNWRCGLSAGRALAAEIGRNSIECRSRGTDPYDRVLAVCYDGGEDLNDWMVRTGWAVAYRHFSMDYVSAEEEARDAKRGIWEGTFENPHSWRVQHRK